MQGQLRLGMSGLGLQMRNVHLRGRFAYGQGIELSLYRRHLFLGRFVLELPISTATGKVRLLAKA
ncbi:hypothetical protein D3C81_1031680 [compost metagenome]